MTERVFCLFLFFSICSEVGFLFSVCNDTEMQACFSDIHSVIWSKVFLVLVRYVLLKALVWDGYVPVIFFIFRCKFYNFIPCWVDHRKFGILLMDAHSYVPAMWTVSLPTRLSYNIIWLHSLSCYKQHTWVITHSYTFPSLSVYSPERFINHTDSVKNFKSLFQSLQGLHGGDTGSYIPEKRVNFSILNM